MDHANYTIRPYIESGFGRGVQPETPEATHASTQITFHFDVSGNGLSASKRVRVLGPGEVASVASFEIKRLYPRPGVSNAEPNYFPMIEFHKADLPWILSPEGRTADRKKPWLVLIVLEAEEFTPVAARNRKARPSIRIRHQQSLPKLQESWAWSHLQIDGLKAGEDERTILKKQSHRAFSRLLCARYLKANRFYSAFLVPGYERGRLSGLYKLHLQSNPVPAAQPAWDHTSPNEIELPYYYSWSFSTGPMGDFETLVKKLLPPKILPSTVGFREMDVRDLGYQLPETTEKEPPTFFMKGALLSPAAKAELDVLEAGAVVTPAFQEQFIDLLNQSSIQITLNDSETLLPIGPALYGKWHAAKQHIDQDIDPSWFEELNLDLSMRAAAGLGTRVIREHQERLMAAAWDQVNGINLLNQQLRQSQLSVEVSRCLHKKHLESLGEEDLFMLTSQLHAAIPTAENADSVGEAFSESLMPLAVYRWGFLKNNRKSGPILKRMQFNRVQEPKFKEVLKRLFVGELKVAPALEPAAQAPPSSNVPVQEADVANIPDGVLPVFQTFQSDLVGGLHPNEKVLEDIEQRLKVPSWPNWQQSNDLAPLEPVMAHPEITQAMYDELRDLSPDWLLPGIANIENNLVSLLETNQAFIEAFMAGLNHEMARELLWREYPTDQRGTYFSHFWSADFYEGYQGPVQHKDALKDIRPMVEWENAHLGENRPVPLEDGHSLVLLIRGDLLFRYPNTIIYAQKAKLKQGDPPISQGGKRTFGEEKRYPLFKGFIPPDISFLGFNLSREEVLGNIESQNDDEQGWYFVLMENPSEPRFGLDLNDRHFGEPVKAWSNFSWNHLAENQTELDDLKYIDIVATSSKIQLVNTGLHIPSWNSNSSDMAAICFQKPFLAGIHGSDMLP